MNKKYILVALMSVVPIAIILYGMFWGFIWLPATFEANAFNKFSKIKATPWDAIWTDLKVTSQ